MSGINALKEKSKKHLETHEKRKMGLGDMFENQIPGNPDIQKSGNPESQQPRQQDAHQSLNSIVQKEPYFSKEQIPHNLPSQSNNFSISEETKRPLTEASENTNPPIEGERQEKYRLPIASLVKQQKFQKVPTCKMSFELREDIYKAFNDLYANRMLQGRGTGKSEMVCEAIQLLLEAEECLKRK